MPSTLISRRALTTRLIALPVGLGIAARVSGELNDREASKPVGDGLTRTSEAIHQEVMFKGSPQRIFAALTTSKDFDAITRLSDAVTLVTAKGAKPTSIHREVGGSFTLFGGYITGRNLEMLPDQR